jgi:hypothetical protein
MLLFNKVKEVVYFPALQLQSVPVTSYFARLQLLAAAYCCLRDLEPKVVASY